VVSLAVTAGPALAGPFDPPATPERYKHRFDGKMREFPVRWGGAFAVCKREYERVYPGETYDVRNMFVGERPLLGCAIGGKQPGPHNKRRGVIVYTVGLPNTAQIREHEIAHLNGWPAHHPR